jgi:hypothetical protein
MTETVHVTTEGRAGAIVAIERQECAAGDGATQTAVRWEPVFIAAHVLELQPDAAGKLRDYARWLGRHLAYLRRYPRLRLRAVWLEKRRVGDANSLVAPARRRMGWGGRARLGRWRRN